MLTILYIHGFASCGNSSKALYLKEFANVISPELSHHPETALKQLRSLLSNMDTDELIIVGTSLGGWYANEMANEFGINELLINPLTNIDEMKKVIGKNTNFCTNLEFEFTKEDFNFLKNYQNANYKPWQKAIWLSENDEVLNNKYAKEYYKDKSEITLFENKDHRFDLNGTFIEEKLEKMNNTLYLVNDDL
jgi:predicted esterase YcpF (UPF0227 family)